MCRISDEMVELVRNVVDWNDGVLFVGDTLDDTKRCVVGFYNQMGDDRGWHYYPFEINIVKGKLYVTLDNGDEYTLFDYLVGEVNTNYEAFQELTRFIDKYDIDYLEGLF